MLYIYGFCHEYTTADVRNTVKDFHIRQLLIKIYLSEFSAKCTRPEYNSLLTKILSNQSLEEVKNIRDS